MEKPVTDSHGPTTTNTYDQMERLVKRVVSAGGVSEVTSFAYYAHLLSQVYTPRRPTKSVLLISGARRDLDTPYNRIPGTTAPTPFSPGQYKLFTPKDQ
jgi:hypothetical protein